MMTAEFTKVKLSRAYPYLAERTDDELTDMIVIFIALDKALKISAHTIQVVDANEHNYTPIQGAFTLAFGGESECDQGGGLSPEAWGRLFGSRP